METDSYVTEAEDSERDMSQFQKFLKQRNKIESQGGGGRHVERRLGSKLLGMPKFEVKTMSRNEQSDKKKKKQEYRVLEMKRGQRFKEEKNHLCQVLT